MAIHILGIETSCDETGVAIYKENQGIIAQSLASQVDLHAEYGGVVPELASRDHIRKTALLTREVLQQANLTKADINGVAYTQGPGLVGALLVGATFAKSLAFGWGCPAIGIHHMEGHLVAALLGDNPPECPFVALLVSGGHTMLIAVEQLGCYQVLGESIDDAAGEAFDKTAKLMGLGYPGGPALAQLAEKGRKGQFHFPRPMTDRPGLDMSFSGLKTYAANTLQAHDNSDAQVLADIALAFEEAVADTLVIKCRRALQSVNYSRLVVAGGVSANKRLRASLNGLMKKMGGEVYYPAFEYCTDNGAMIAFAGYLRYMKQQKESLNIQVKPRWPMSEL